jgi:hypothetical protein
MSALHISGRAVALVLLVGAAALAIPAAVQAQSVTPERALLNSATAFTQAPAVPVAVAQAALDGARALLNRSVPAYGLARESEAFQTVLGDALHVDGVRALMNRSRE